MQGFSYAPPILSLVELELDEGETCSGVLVEITQESATIDFPLAASALLIGDSAWLSFREGRVASMIRTLARIEHRGEDAERCRYRFAISAEDSIALTTLIEHRQALRVGPPDGLVVPVQLWVEGGKEVAACLDSISCTGISVLFAEDPDPFAQASVLQLRLRLPDQAQTIAIAGRVRARRLIDGQQRYGLEFEAGPAIEFGRKQRKIESYVGARLLEVLNQVRSQRSPKR